MSLDTLTIKLMSLAVHAEEYMEGVETFQPKEADAAAIQGLLSDPEVVQAREEMDSMALLPVKR